jgi:hypothetical protein
MKDISNRRRNLVAWSGFKGSADRLGHAYNASQQSLDMRVFR